MFPLRTSSIFKSRWWALLWAAGIIWLAYDVASSAPTKSTKTASAEQATDASGSPISSEDEDKFDEILNGL